MFTKFTEKFEAVKFCNSYQTFNRRNICERLKISGKQFSFAMDFESACRVCLSVNLELFDIFSELESSSYSYRDIIKEIAQLDHNEVDLISKNICVTCRDCCIEFVKFRELITNSNEYQLMALRNEGELKTVVERQVFEDEIVLIDEVEKPLVDESIELSVDINDLGDTDTNDDQLIFSDELTDDAASAGFITDQSGESDEETVESNVNDSTFSCSKCEQSFKRKSKLEEHVKTHSPKARTNQCKTCKRKFTTEVLLTRHEIIHSDLITQIKSENHQSCIVCNASFKNKPLMEDHMRDHRVKIETEAICCLHCDKPYNKLSNLIRHLKTHDVNKTHLCNVCNKTFAMGQDLIDHLNRHKGFNPHSCHICNKSYMQMSKLKNHLRTHSDDKVSRNFSKWRLSTKLLLISGVSVHRMWKELQSQQQPPSAPSSPHGS